MSLHDGWELLSVAPGTYQSPGQLLAAHENAWLAAAVPGTVVEALQHNQKWDIAHPFNTDSLDWWYRCSFHFSATDSDHQVVLLCNGLATIADVRINDQHILSANNMFCAAET
jgi:beta-mannosidase